MRGAPVEIGGLKLFDLADPERCYVEAPCRYHPPRSLLPFSAISYASPTLVFAISYASLCYLLRPSPLSHTRLIGVARYSRALS
eukprot:1575152-Rhodomonas_salina.1